MYLRTVSCHMVGNCSKVLLCSGHSSSSLAPSMCGIKLKCTSDSFMQSIVVDSRDSAATIGVTGQVHSAF